MFVVCNLRPRFQPYIIYYLLYGCWVNSFSLSGEERVIRINMFSLVKQSFATKYTGLVCVCLRRWLYYIFFSSWSPLSNAACIYVYIQYKCSSSLSYSRRPLCFDVFVAPDRIEIIWSLILTRKHLPPNVSMDLAVWKS